MKNIFIVIVVLFINIKNTKAQYAGSTTQGRSSAGNLLFNGGFETADGQGYPNGLAQVNNLESWESRVKTVQTAGGLRRFHSPDWVYNGQHSEYSPAPTPVSGSGVVGMLNYELIQQNFRNEEMKAGELYVVSMYIYLYSSTQGGTIDNSSLKCYLAKQGVHYKSEDNITQQQECSQQYVDYQTINNQLLEIGSWNLNLSNYPNTNGWTKISAVFRAPSNTFNWDYFMIDLRQNNYTSSGSFDHCYDGYVFIDEVSLEEVDQCGKTCSPGLGAIQYSTMPNAIVANNAPGFTMLIKDAMGINFTVFNRWGEEIYNQNAYDPNGLKDTGYPDYYFSWTGQKPDGSLFPQDVYTYTLRLWNCSYDQTYTSSLTYLIGNGSATQGYDLHNTQLADCCIDYLEIQNKQYFSGVTIEKADNYIIAGTYINSTPNGPVICRSGSDVKYVSELIILHPGFSVESGGKFIAIATGICSDQLVRSRDVNRDRPDFEALKISTLDNIAGTAYNISPNPSNDGVFTFVSNVEYNYIETIELYDVFGKLIKNNNNINSSLIIDLNNYSKGMYFLKIKFKNSPSVIVEKLIYN
ncbi:MAG: T9SS type A sorting domain-containing protein [Bacteroidota bacterium]